MPSCHGQCHPVVTSAACPGRTGLVFYNASEQARRATGVNNEMSAIPGILGGSCLSAFRRFICAGAIHGCVTERYIAPPGLPTCRSLCDDITSSCSSFMLMFIGDEHLLGYQTNLNCVRFR